MFRPYTKFLYLFLTFLFCPDGLKAQEDTVFMRYNAGGWDSLYYVTDTLIFYTPYERHILKGTAVLPWTANQQNAKGYGLYLNSITRSGCPRTKGDQNMARASVSSINFTDTTLIVEIKIFENCCYDFLADVSVDTSGMINLIYHGYGTFCGCQCCFGLTYYFRREPYADGDRLRAVIINGDQRTGKALPGK